MSKGKGKKMMLMDTTAYATIAKLNNHIIQKELDNYKLLILDDTEWPLFWDTVCLEYRDTIANLMSDITTGIPAFQYLTEGKNIQAYKEESLLFCMDFIEVYTTIKPFTNVYQNMAWRDYINFRPKTQRNLLSYQN